ncbi:MAG: helix-turn-helix transcriptional regulator [Bacillota bacterium]|nr:helix-turn-helix transcriptional regulator [Bacillota bacterium]
MSDFGENLKKLRKQKGYSQVRLAKELHYGSTAIANYESGRNEPSFAVLIRLAELLDVTVDELIGVEETTEEAALLAAFKKLDEENKKRVLDLIQALQA